MKYSLTALLLLGLAPAGLAQVGDQTSVKTYDPTITYVAASAHHNLGGVEILGRDLNVVTSVKVNGALVPILANDGHRMVIQPGDQVPGFGTLELLYPHRTLRHQIEFNPSLDAHRLEQSLQVRLHTVGEGTLGQGWYFVNYSFRARPTPLIYGGVHYGELLDMNIANSGILFSGMVTTHEPMVFPPIRIPARIGVLSDFGLARPVYVQALTSTGTTLCFSNMVTLRPNF